MSPLAFLAEPMSFRQGMVTIAVMFIVGMVVVVIGGYAFVRIIAYIFNHYQGGWESSAKPLGLTVDKKAGGLYKPLVGDRNGFLISITHFSINPTTSSIGVVSVDHCALVEVALRTPLGFSLRLNKRETFLEKAARYFVDESDQVGHEFFDQVFEIECSDLRSLRTLLNVELKDGGSPTILTDLVHAAKKYDRVILTDRSLSFGIEAEFGQTDAIEPVITHGIHIAQRIETAAN